MAIYAVFKHYCPSIKTKINLFAPRFKLLMNESCSDYAELEHWGATA